MSIADKIIRLQNAKDAISDAIIERGGIVNPGDGYEEFAVDIRTIKGMEYIVGSQNSATASWVGTTTNSSLDTGKTIAYKLPYDSTGNVTLNLTLSNGTTTGAKDVYLNTTRLSTQYNAGAVIVMTYDGTRWNITDTNNFSGDISVAGAISASGAISATGDLSTTGNLSSTGNVTIGGTITAAGKATFNNEAIFNEDSVFGKDITIGGKIQRKNLFKINESIAFGTSNNIVYSDNGDGGVKVNGTNSTTATTRYRIIGSFLGEANHRYILTGTGGNTKCYLYISSTDAGSAITDKTGNGTEFTFTGQTAWNIRIGVTYGGTTITDQVIYPMIRDASIVDGTWEEYIPDIPEVQDDYNTKIDTVVNSIETYQGATQFRIASTTGTFNLIDYATSGAFLVLLRDWTVSAPAHSIYLVSLINSGDVGSTAIITDNKASLSFSGTTATVTFADSEGGMVCILGAPII